MVEEEKNLKTNITPDKNYSLELELKTCKSNMTTGTMMNNLGASISSQGRGLSETL